MSALSLCASNCDAAIRGEATVPEMPPELSQLPRPYMNCGFFVPKTGRIGG
jgi:hypothetical protein